MRGADRARGDADGGRTAGWRLHVASSPERVYELIATDAGRRRFWVDLRNHDPGPTWDEGYADD